MALQQVSEELKTGTELSHYRIVAKIGEGGMGEVYRAEDTKLDRQVALKVLPAAAADDDERVRRFVQEAKAASALNHPNILTVFEIGSVDGVRYIATEFVNGQTLRDCLNGEPLTLRAALDIFAQAAAALTAAHDAGIVHRDIKPENIMVRSDGLVKVLDFGLAKLTDRSPAVASSEDATRALVNTRPGMVMGTVAYMSPEQARGKETDARTDVWSLGVVMFEMLTRRCPFEGDGPMDIVSSILKDPTPVLRTVAPDLPRQLERIIDKTLRKDRDQRYQHIKDLQIDLDDLREEIRFEEKQGKTVEIDAVYINVLPDIHVSSCVQSILQGVIIFKPVGLITALTRVIRPTVGNTLADYTSSSRRVGSSSSSLIATRKPTDSRPSIRRWS